MSAVQLCRPMCKTSQERINNIRGMSLDIKRRTEGTHTVSLAINTLQSTYKRTSVKPHFLVPHMEQVEPPEEFK